MSVPQDSPAPQGGLTAALSNLVGKLIPAPVAGFVRACVLGSSIVSLCLGLNVVQIISLLGVPFFPQRVRQLNCACAAIIWTCFQVVFERLHSAKLTFSGDLPPERESAIVFANHRSFTDFMLVHAFGYRRKMMMNSKYFAKDSLKYIPAFGWGIWLLGMIFVRRDFGKDQTRLAQAFSRIVNNREPAWVISYLEGSRFTERKHASAVEFAKKRDLPVPQHTLVPRTKGFLATLRALRGTHVEHVYDLTLVYDTPEGFMKAPSIWRIHTGPLDGFRFHVHCRRYRIADIPEDEEEAQKWAMERFQEKDELLVRMESTWTKGLKMLDLPWPGINADTLVGY